MRECPNCGFRDNPLWRASKFEFNADYMKEEDFAEQYPELNLALGPKPETLGDGPIVYYRRGKREKQVYRVLREDYKVETEKVNKK